MHEEEKESRLYLIESKLETIKKEFDLLSHNLLIDNFETKNFNINKQKARNVNSDTQINNLNRDVISVVDNKEIINKTKSIFVPAVDARSEINQETVIKTQAETKIETQKPSDIIVKAEKHNIVETNTVKTILVKEQNQYNCEVSKTKKMQVFHNPSSPENVKTDKSNKLSSMLNDKHVTNKSVLLADNIAMPKVDDIRTLIGINDRFLFIRELFDGKNDEYNDVIDKVNKSLSFTDAYKYINDNKTWDMEDSIVQDFINICKRKF